MNPYKTLFQVLLLFYKFQLQAESLKGLAITYSFVSGELPPGMDLVDADRYDANGNLSIAGGTLQGELLPRPYGSGRIDRRRVAGERLEPASGGQRFSGN